MAVVAPLAESAAEVTAREARLVCRVHSDCRTYLALPAQLPVDVTAQAASGHQRTTGSDRSRARHILLTCPSASTSL